MPDFASKLANIVESGQRLLWIHTSEEDRAVQFVRAAAKLSGAKVLEWSSASLFKNQPTPQAIVDTIKRFNSKIYIAIKDAHLLFVQDKLVARRIKDILPHIQEFEIGVFFISPTVAIPIEFQGVCAIEDLPLPSTEELYELFLKEWNQRKNEAKIDVSVVERAAYSGAGLAETEAVAAFRRMLQGGESASAEDMLSVFAELKRQYLRNVAGLDVVEAAVSIDDVGGLGELKKWLLARRDAFSRKAQEFGLPRPKGLLMLGVQGCGKSLVSKAVASVFGFPVVKMDIGALFSSGESADERMRNALARCEALSPVVLWIDEVEKGFAGSSGANSDATRLLGLFLSWMQEHGSPVFVVATANNIELLPPEFVRRGRFDEIFFVDLPSDEERKEIFAVHLKRRGRKVEGFDLERLAEHTRNFSGAEIEQVVIAGLYRAFAEDRNLTMDDLLREAELLVPLYRVQEEAIKRLREWAETRARHASSDRSVLRYFK